MRDPSRSSRGTGAGTSLPAGVCAALLGSALVHATVVQEHLHEWVVAGGFFAFLVVGETALALAGLYAWKRHLARLLARLVVVSGVATVALWVMSRTVGLPFGPADFRVPEGIGTPDVACCILEVVAVALSLPLAVGRIPTGGRSPGRSMFAAGSMVLVALVVTVWGLGPAMSGEGHHHSAQHAGPAPGAVRSAESPARTPRTG